MATKKQTASKIDSTPLVPAPPKVKAPTKRAPRPKVARHKVVERRRKNEQKARDGKAPNFASNLEAAVYYVKQAGGINRLREQVELIALVQGAGISA